jgi:glycogen debranching enzyme
MFASFGAIAIGDTKQAWSTVQLFLGNLNSEGLVPMRIGAKDEALRYLGLCWRFGPVYKQDKGSNPAVDPNLLILILAEAVERAGGARFDREKLRAVTSWIERNTTTNGLIHQGPYADWEDSIKTRGVRLYTSVCLARALRSAAYLLKDSSYIKRAERVERAVQSWWMGTHFSDGPKDTRMMTAGNLLAIIWKIATKKQSQTILAKLAVRKSVCPPAGDFKPTPRSVYTPFFLIGIADYHASVEWSWLAPLEAIAYDAVGMKKEAAERWKRFDALVEKHGAVYEVYEKDEPLRRLVYRSERNFAWTIGIRLAKKL